MQISLQSYKKKPSFSMIVILFFYAFISWSMPLDIIGVRGSTIVALTLFVMLFIAFTKRRIPELWFFIIIGLMVLSAGISSYIWNDIRLIAVPIYIITALVLLSCATFKELEKCVDIASVFIFFLLIGAILGFIFAALGVPPILEFSYGDHSKSYFYLTTFTNEAGRFIRPAGIYDEPGALSFVVCALTYIRHEFGKSNKITWLLLLLGLITFSLAHLVFLIIYYLSFKFSAKNIIIAIITISIFVPAILVMSNDETVSQHTIGRLEINDEGRLSGDNRSGHFETALQIVTDNPEIIMKGLGPECLFDIDACSNKYGYFGTNLLSMLVGNGLLNSWPYYVFLVVGFSSLIQLRKSIVFFGIVLLFLQRPYFMALGYSLLGVISLWLHLRVFAVKRFIK